MRNSVFFLLELECVEFTSTAIDCLAYRIHNNNPEWRLISQIIWIAIHCHRRQRHCR